MTFLPSPAYTDASDTCIDGHFGHREISRWPQEIDGDAIHRAWILNPEDSHGNIDGDVVSFRLQRDHFVPSDTTQKARCPLVFMANLSSVAAKATLDAKWFQARSSYEKARPTALYHTLQLAVEKLELNDLSWREMNETIAECQRCIVELKAYAAYREDIEKKWKPDTAFKASSVRARLGGFTSSAYLAQVLFILGVPVWIRHNSTDGLDPSLRSLDILYPMYYLELAPWPADTAFSTSNSISMLKDLSALPRYPRPDMYTERDNRRNSRSRSPDRLGQLPPARGGGSLSSRRRSISPRELHFFSPF
jgi:hypothetical protein